MNHLALSIISIFLLPVSSIITASTSVTFQPCDSSTNCTEVAITQDTLAALLPNSQGKVRTIEILDSCASLDPFGYSDIIQLKINQLRSLNNITNIINTYNTGNNNFTLTQTNATTISYGQVSDISNNTAITTTTIIQQPLSNICQNVKLSKAAQLQSTYQAILNMSTHAGPRMLIPQGNVVERVLAQNYTLDSTSTIKEFIYHFENLPSNTSYTNPPPFDDAIKQWASDPDALSELLNPNYEFMGVGFGRGTEFSDTKQSLYLTLILATQTPFSSESCSICPIEHDPAANNSTLIYLQSGQILSSSDLKPRKSSTSTSDGASWSLD